MSNDLSTIIPKMMFGDSMLDDKSLQDFSTPNLKNKECSHNSGFEEIFDAP